MRQLTMTNTWSTFVAICICLGPVACGNTTDSVIESMRKSQPDAQLSVSAAPDGNAPSGIVGVDPKSPSQPSEPAKPIDWSDSTVLSNAPWSSEKLSALCRMAHERFAEESALPYIFRSWILPSARHEFAASCGNEIARKAISVARQHERKRNWEQASSMWEFLIALTGEETYRAEFLRVRPKAVAQRDKRVAREAREATQQLNAQIASQMRVFSETGDGLGIAVAKTKWQKCLGHECSTSSDWGYLLIYVVAKNFGAKPNHVNPTRFTVTHCTSDAALETATFGLSHLEGLTLQPGSDTEGWLAFFANKSCTLHLNYLWGYQQSLAKPIAVP